MATLLARTPLSTTHVQALSGPTVVASGQARTSSCLQRHRGTLCLARSRSASSSIDVELQPRQRAPPPLPEPVPVMHSTPYLQARRTKGQAQESTELASTSNRGRDASDDADADGLLWALKRLDKKLDQLEANPLPLQNEIYALSKSPVGTATGSAMEAAAKLTVQASKEALRAALPVGQWLAKEGAKAAVSIAAQAMTQSVKPKQFPWESRGKNDKPKTK